MSPRCSGTHKGLPTELGGISLPPRLGQEEDDTQSRYSGDYSADEVQPSPADPGHDVGRADTERNGDETLTAQNETRLAFADENSPPNEPCLSPSVRASMAYLRGPNDTERSTALMDECHVLHDEGDQALDGAGSNCLEAS